MSTMSVHEAVHQGDRVVDAGNAVIKILIDARLTPAMSVGLLEDIKLRVLVGAV